MAIVILSRGKSGLSKCVSHYLVAMASADLIVVFTAVIGEEINNMYLFANFLLITPVCAVTVVLRVAAMDCSVWFTVAFTFDRFIAICCQKVRERYCTQRTARLVIVAVGTLSCGKAIPVFFTVEPHAILDHVPWRCVATPEYLTSSGWKAYEYIDSIITPLLPIILMLLFNCSTIRHIIAANKVRRGLRCTSENQKDPEMENRKKSMILLFAISANFILLWIFYVVHSLIWQTQNYTYTDKYLNTPVYIAQQVSFMLRLLSVCTNTCIYVLTQRKFREEMAKGVKYIFCLTPKN
ncbi:probable G-protein coupled receptor 139 [Narcine bancroftii]|uniref:probable G-protein coupled receptor 139 n=1 Tax=Narcine bancroftii TaxID=1343680 RepID=UPI003831ED03